MESQADDTAAQMITSKWKELSEKHQFQEAPLMVGRYGFSATCATDVHRIIGYANTLLFFVIDAAARGERLGVELTNPKKSLYPTVAYRIWRAFKWQKFLGVSSGNWRDYIEHVRSDLEKDHFPDAGEIFRNQLNDEDNETYDELLMSHSKFHEEGQALIDFELKRKVLIKPQRPLSQPCFWGEKFELKNWFSIFVRRKND